MSASSPPPTNSSSSPAPHPSTSAGGGTVTGATTVSNSDPTTTTGDATTKLAEAIDDFLGDLEKKFKGISDEILTKLDDMAERCDRLEQEMLLRDAGAIDAGALGKGATA